jgi:hypothetical protein
MWKTPWVRDRPITCAHNTEEKQTYIHGQSRIRTHGRSVWALGRRLTRAEHCYVTRAFASQYRVTSGEQSCSMRTRVLHSAVAIFANPFECYIISQYRTVELRCDPSLHHLMSSSSTLKTSRVVTSVLLLCVKVLVYIWQIHLKLIQVTLETTPNISFQIYYLAQIRVNKNMITGEDQTQCTQAMDMYVYVCI